MNGLRDVHLAPSLWVLPTDRADRPITMAGDDVADLQSASVETCLRSFIGQTDHVWNLDHRRGHDEHQGQDFQHHTSPPNAGPMPMPAPD